MSRPEPLTDAEESMRPAYEYVGTVDAIRVYTMGGVHALASGGGVVYVCDATIRDIKAMVKDGGD